MNKAHVISKKRRSFCTNYTAQHPTRLSYPNIYGIQLIDEYFLSHVEVNPAYTNDLLWRLVTVVIFTIIIIAIHVVMIVTTVVVVVVTE